MNGNYSLDSSVIQALKFSQKLLNTTNVVPRVIFSVAMFLIPGTAVNELIRLNGNMNYDTLSNHAFSYLSDLGTFEVKASFYDLKIDDSSSIMIEDSLFELFDRAIEIAKEKLNDDQVYLSCVVSAYEELYNEEYSNLMTYLLPNSSKSQSKLAVSKVKSTGKSPLLIPKELAPFLTNLNEKITPESEICPICSRDFETNSLCAILLKAKKRNAILVGEPGVGKTAIVEKLVWQIVKGQCPEQLMNCVVVSLDINALIAGTVYRGMAEERFDDLINFLKDNPQVILFIDEVHLLLGAGSCSEGTLDLANSLKPILARGETRVIGATTSDEYENYFTQDGALSRRFEKVNVNEPTSDEVYSMIKNQITFLEKFHGVKISKAMVNFAILIASAFDYTTHNPDRTLDVIDKSLTTASILGRKSVRKSDILSAFDSDQNTFKSMSYEEKQAVAFHEAAHLILNVYSPELVDIRVTAVSIIPTDSYVGVNVIEPIANVLKSYSYDYYIQLIATLFAGRVAEKQYFNSYNSGASSDIDKATKIAQKVVTQFALVSGLTKNRSYDALEFYETYTEDIKNKINSAIDKVLDEAYRRAQLTLAEHEEELFDIVDALVNGSGILSEDEIAKILNI